MLLTPLAFGCPTFLGLCIFSTVYPVIEFFAGEFSEKAVDEMYLVVTLV